MMKMRMLWLHQLASCLILLIVQVEESHAFSVGREYRFVHARAAPKTIVVPIAPSPPSSPRAEAVTMILSSTPKDDDDNNNNDNDNNKKKDEDPLGLARGAVLLGVVALANLWSFSIPPDYRRAKLCSQEQVVLYPKSKCMTGSMWWGGVMNYYRNGGGVQFDFSIEPEN
jgi:hypothetical protein